MDQQTGSSIKVSGYGSDAKRKVSVFIPGIRICTVSYERGDCIRVTDTGLLDEL